MKLRLSLLSKRRRSVLAVRTVVRLGAKKRVSPKLALSSGRVGELAFERLRVEMHPVDGLAGRLLR